MKRSRAFVLTAALGFLAATVALFATAGLSLGQQVFVDPWLDSGATWSDRALSIVPAIVVALLALRVLRRVAAHRQALPVDA